MTASPPFTNEEIDELVSALQDRRDRLIKVYLRPGKGSAEWNQRERMFNKLRDKLIGMRP